MTDAEKCRMIAEFEFFNPKLPSEGYPVADYPHDLNATMRAARKLPRMFRLEIAVEQSKSWATLTNEEGRTIAYERTIDGDPARAAFKALSSWLAAKDGRSE
jgi:hypothetical protein